jgi:hypothetical protein
LAPTAKELALITDWEGKQWNGIDSVEQPMEVDGLYDSGTAVGK